MDCFDGALVTLVDPGTGSWTVKDARHPLAGPMVGTCGLRFDSDWLTPEGVTR